MQPTKKQKRSAKKELEELKTRVNSNENILREKSLEIHGIPFNSGEKLSKPIINLAKNFNLDLNENDIDSVYRIKRKERNNKPEHCIFCKKRNKSKIYVTTEE